MLQISEDAFERAIAALIGLDLGVPVEGVAQAALHLVRQHRLRREEARELLREQPFLVAADDAETGAADACPGVPHAAPQEELAAPPAGAIPAPCPRRVRNASVQAGPVLVPANPIESRLMKARALDYAAHQRRAETFEALDRYKREEAELVGSKHGAPTKRLRQNWIL